MPPRDAAPRSFRDPRVTPAVRERYLLYLPIMREVARQLGYALAVHGSETYDFDVIAVPWIEDAKSPAELAEALRIAVDGFIDPQTNPIQKPHGRLSYTIVIGGGAYIDLAVMQS